MAHRVRRFTRIALWALPIWAALLFLSTLTQQPDTETAFADFAEYVTTPQFLVSHLVGSILGAALGSIGVIGLMLYLQDSRAAGKAITGMVATVMGNTLLTALFGAAAFAQPAAGRMFQAGQQNAVEFYNQVYGPPLFATAIVGLLLFIVGGVFTGIAIATSGSLPRWTGWVYAVATAGFVFSWLFLSVGMSIFTVLLTVVTVVIALNASRVESKPYDPATAIPNT